MSITILKGRNRMKRSLMTIAILSLVSMIPLATSSYGAVIIIPDNHPTIQAGIDAAANGDTVLVRDGTYLLTAAIDFKGKAITVRSENGADSCILDGQSATSVVYFHSGEGNNSVLSGFTIRNGKAQKGGGIHLDSSSPTITESTISANKAYHVGPTYGNGYAYGGGIFSIGSSPKIRYCNITGNQSEAHGGPGTSAGSGGYPFAYGAGIYINGGAPEITGCLIDGNTATITAGNRAWGGGIYSNGASPSLVNTTISNNSLASLAYDSQGGGIYFAAGSPLMINCIISGNSAKEGGGIYFNQSSAFSNLTNCTVVRNTATINGGGIYCDITSPKIINSILWEDSPQEIYIEGTSDPTITYSDVYGGYAGIGNIAAFPAFVNIAAKDLRLTGTSPCINRGSNAAQYLPVLDKDGNARIHGPIVDIGAYEYQYEHPSAELSVFREGNGTWYTLSSSPPGFSNTQWGLSSDILVPGDYDGDGRIDYAVWRPSTGMWYVLLRAAPGFYTETQWGLSTDKPVPGDYDFDGKTDIAVYRPSSGMWYVLPSGCPGTFTETQWGTSTDVPIPPLMGIRRPAP